MKTIYVTKKNGKIIAWSSKKMSEDEVELVLTEQEYKDFLATQEDVPMNSGEIN
jgi:hypothetical protein